MFVCGESNLTQLTSLEMRRGNFIFLIIFINIKKKINTFVTKQQEKGNLYKSYTSLLKVYNFLIYKTNCVIKYFHNEQV